MRTKVKMAVVFVWSAALLVGCASSQAPTQAPTAGTISTADRAELARGLKEIGINAYAFCHRGGDADELDSALAARLGSEYRDTGVGDLIKICCEVADTHRREGQYRPDVLQGMIDLALRQI